MTLDPKEIRSAVWPAGTPIPTRVLRCRSCSTRNRVEVPTAVLEPARCLCGRCDAPLLRKPEEPFVDLASRAYEHELDRASLDALRAIPGFPALLKKILTYVSERPARILYRSAFVECGPEQFPALVTLLDTARTRLGLPLRPTLFLGHAPHANASIVGAEDPAILVNTGLVDLLSDAELVAVLGHELGHLHADHALYRSMAQLLASGAVALGGFGTLVTWPLQKALAKWSRCAELTCDRAGLLAARDLGASLGALLALAGGPSSRERGSLQLAPFVRQARALAEAERTNIVEGTIATLLTLDASHPFVAWRVMHLLEWVEHGSYLDLLAGDHEQTKALPTGT